MTPHRAIPRIGISQHAAARLRLFNTVTTTISAVVDRKSDARKYSITSRALVLGCATILGCLSILIAFTPAFATPSVGETGTVLGPSELAVIINDLDPLSRAIADYYQKRRNIPATNMIHIRFPPGRPVMSRDEFMRIKTEVDSRTPRQVQAFALTWAAPYRVDCMSITSAFAIGFNTDFCSSSCSPTKRSPYFNSDSRAPYLDHGLRPTMALAGLRFEDVRKLIDRAIKADGTFPKGTAYLVSTSDKARNRRAELFPTTMQRLKDHLHLKLVNADFISHRSDVLFYFTGTSNVQKLDTIRFLPGAIADHLTSHGGNLTDSPQMSSLRWLEAGATGSYGTVVEPCSIIDKFPSPGIVILHYLKGQTLVEAYWKGVAMPGQGIFIGEPLAQPYATGSIADAMVRPQ